MNKEEQLEARLSKLENQLDKISGQLDQIIEAKRPFTEMKAELGPIAHEVMNASIKQLADLDERGYFAFAYEIRYLLDRLVEDYDPDDLHEFADNSANILDTIRTLTQPSVMSVARDAAAIFEDAKSGEPIGALGAWKRIRQERDIQRGIGFALDLLGSIGRGIARAPRHSRALESGYAKPTSSVSRPTPSTKKITRDASAPAAPVKLNAESVFLPDEEWNEDVAKSIAAELGVGELRDAHFELINFVRADYKETGMTPNIRRITTQTGVATRDVYQLFPKAPGLTIARVAGVPKPVGCL